MKEKKRIQLKNKPIYRLTDSLIASDFAAFFALF